MPPVIAVIAAYVGTAAFVAAGYAVGTAVYFATYALVSAGLMIGLGAAAKALMGKPKSPTTPTLAEDIRGRTVMVRSSVEPHRVIYGQCLVSGPLVFATSTGTTNEYIHLIVALAGHEVEEIGDVYFDDTISTDARFNGLTRINKHLGADDQTADSDLVAEVTDWTTEHRLRGIAYIYLRLLWNAEVWLNGIPNIKCLVKGRKVYDPRTTSTVWSQNAALCQRDYLRAAFGINATPAEVDDSILSASANICDEDVALDAGGTQKRYTCDGAFDLSQRPIDIMDDLLTASAGTMVYSQGTYKIHAGAYATPTVPLTEDDLRGPIEVISRASRRDAFNAVRGTFVDGANYYQANDFPILTNSTYAAEDGQVLYRDLELPYTTNVIRAQRLAKLALDHGRNSMTVKFPAKLTAMGLTAWNTVYVSIAQLGWTSKIFRVLEWTLTDDGGIDLTLQEESAASYGWMAEETVPDVAPEVPLPGPEDNPSYIPLPPSPPVYTVTNVTPDRDYDADATSTAELADVLGTLIEDLRATGVVD